MTALLANYHPDIAPLVQEIQALLRPSLAAGAVTGLRVVLARVSDQSRKKFQDNLDEDMDWLCGHPEAAWVKANVTDVEAFRATPAGERARDKVGMKPLYAPGTKRLIGGFLARGGWLFIFLLSSAAKADLPQGRNAATEAILASLLAVAHDDPHATAGRGKAQSDTTVKLVAAPYNLPLVVVPLGRASVKKVDAVELVNRVLDELPFEDLRTMELRTITLHLVSGLVGADAVWPQEGFGEDAEPLRTGFSLLVAGYCLATTGAAEVWTATVPTRGLPPQLSPDPVTVCGSGKESDKVIRNLFDSFEDDLDAGTLTDDPDTYKLRGLTMAQVQERAEELLRTVAALNPRELWAGGVGGRWLLAQVGHDGPVNVEPVDIGPMVVRS